MKKSLNHHPSPLQEIKDKQWAEKDVRLYIKRDDLLALSPKDPFCGNKWRKLKYNLLFARDNGYQTILSFGGAYSNHIAALASAGKHFDFKTIGIIRGEKISNPTLDRAERDGMQLHFVDRTTYRKKKEESYIDELQVIHGSCYIIPEGGTNGLAIKGTTEMMGEIYKQCSQSPTHIAMACGTGGTMAGAIRGLNSESTAIGISVLKGNFMTKEISKLLDKQSENTRSNWEVFGNYHHGGYAKRTDVLMAFITEFRNKHDIQLEPIYTGKLFYALNQLLNEGYFKKGSIVVGIHTGGLQGWQE